MLTQSQIRKLTPGFVREIRRRREERDTHRLFAGLSNQEIFEKIYQDRIWGRADDGAREFSSGDGSRDQSIVLEYVDAIERFVAGNEGLETALDLGCGDFAVGSRLAHRFASYVAADVASNVIDENRHVYEDSPASFVKLDMTQDELPEADVIFVRQVLQHLSNAEIAKFVDNVQDRFKVLVVTESLSSSLFFRANRDIAVGPGIRIHKKSGVVLESKPFCLRHSRIETIMRLSKGRESFVTKAYFR